METHTRETSLEKSEAEKEKSPEPTNVLSSDEIVGMVIRLEKLAMDDVGKYIRTEYRRWIR